MPVEDAPQFRNAGGANGSENSPPTNMIRDRSDLPRRFHSSCHERDVEFEERLSIKRRLAKLAAVQTSIALADLDLTSITIDLRMCSTV